MYKQYIDPFIRLLILCMLLLVIFVCFKLSIGYIFPFLIAFFIAAVLNTPVTYIEKQWKVPRPLATLSVIVTIFLIFVGLIFIVITEIIQGTAYIMEKFQAFIIHFFRVVENVFIEIIIPFYHKLASFFNQLDDTHQQTIQDNLQKFLNEIGTSFTKLIQSLIIQLPEFVGFFPGSLTIIIFILIATFLMVNDWQNIIKKLMDILPGNILSIVRDVQSGIKKGIIGYIRAQIILIFISAVLIYVGLLIIGVDHALAIAAIAAVVDLLPLVGTGLIFIPWILYSFIISNYSLTIGLAILYIVVIVTRQIIEPKILSANIGINPLVSLIILFITIQLWGIAGVIFAPIILISILVLYQSGIFMKLVHFVLNK
ncbi:sporulation integral membrane protein YtvI [Ornithinibacillus halotolerans]|uniref:Sporulation integral membrane protein YtvI n=1 Tax=Ornithinibacillus halotolerans TaxID=1274357 RepID=A0A916S321_9BACI|nr:sporulation integral membrane protein YtvI [Ornithinibacillus halotolerans]GGA81929.1 sporulation integral membrane protein YtvI [Ornithinibacillus halotolerans]